MELDFRPPRENRLLLRFTYSVLPLIMRAARRIVAVHLPEEDWPHLERLRGGRAILAPNHPTTSDPLIAMFLSRRLSEGFNYVACRELFHGPYGWLIQRLGAYSFLRGLPDRESIKMTRRLLAVLDRKVVIFPEGETYEHNDLTIPFQLGAVQIAFWALDDVHRLGREMVMPLMPVVVKYRCVVDARPAIDAGLRALEQALSLSPVRTDDRYSRLRRVGETVLGRVEPEFGIWDTSGMPLTERIEAAKVAALDRVAREVGVARPAALPLPEQMRRLFNAVYQYADVLADPVDDYARRQHSRRMAAAYPLLLDLRRLENMIAVTDGYVAERMTAERFLDVIGRLQREVLGRVRQRVPREAVVRLVPPIDVGQCYEEYLHRKRETVQEITTRIEGSVRALLAELATLGELVEE
jgi:1-acyl-sn-glycerol-3-phosphate acyltransferase